MRPAGPTRRPKIASARSLVGYIGTRELSISGREEELLAVQEIEKGKFLVVVYCELTNDGFIITAFLTHRIKSLNRRKQIWPK